MGVEPSRDFKGRAIGAICRELDLLRVDRDGIMRVPFLIKGDLRVPPRVDVGEIRRSFEVRDRAAGIGASGVTHAWAGGAQVLREPVIDRKTFAATGRFRYTVLPVFTAPEVVEPDVLRLSRELFNLPFGQVLDYVGALGRALSDGHDFVSQVADATRDTAELADLWHDAGFASLALLLDPDTVRDMVDRDLCSWGIPGSRFLDAWTPLPGASVLPAPVNLAAGEVFAARGYAWAPRSPKMRAYPTRQLHITAGNAPQIPFFSALRALATKSAAVVKSPQGATMPGALLALAAVASAPDHPLTKNLSIVYWPGGDRAVEDAFFAPGAFDRIVVWGAPDSVLSVKERAGFTKVLSFNPRFGMSLIGREAHGPDLPLVAARAVCDSLVANQKACIASQVHYVEGTDQEVDAYAQEVRKALAAFDAHAPNYIPPVLLGELKRLMRGVLVSADWLLNQKDGAFSSGVVVSREAFPILKHPMCRLVVVRPVADLAQAVAYMHPGVSTVGIYPEARRLELRDAIAAAGVSNVLPLGQAGSGFAGQSHDGMMALTELVDWKNG